MNKKQLTVLAAAVLVLICAFVYFMPLRISEIQEETNSVSMILNEFKVLNGKPSIDTAEYQNLNKDQVNDVSALLSQYPYRRTFDTAFSNGSVSELGDMMLSVFVFDAESSNVFVLTSSNKIIINDKSYHMKNSRQLIDKMIETVETKD